LLGDSDSNRTSINYDMLLSIRRRNRRDVAPAGRSRIGRNLHPVALPPTAWKAGGRAHLVLIGTHPLIDQLEQKIERPSLSPGQGLIQVVKAFGDEAPWSSPRRRARPRMASVKRQAAPARGRGRIARRSTIPDDARASYPDTRRPVRRRRPQADQLAASRGRIWSQLSRGTVEKPDVSLRWSGSAAKIKAIG
jgi:hypothetical protein